MVAAVVGSLIGTALAWRPVKRIHRRLFRISDQLDTETPGGLTEVIKAVNASQAPPDQEKKSE